MAATKLSIYQEALRNLADARLAALTDDVESRYALDDAWADAIAFVLSQAPWRFALKTVVMSGSATPVPGYTTAYPLPTDWLRTHAIFIDQSGRELPFDLTEQGSAVSVNIAVAPVIRYVSSTYADPAVANWPPHFSQAAAAYLAFMVAERVTGERSAPARMSQLFSSILPEAIRLDAIAEEEWLAYQRTSAFLRASRTVIAQGFWTFPGAVKTVAITEQSTSDPDDGFPYRFALPTDWMRTHALYIGIDGQDCPINIREDARDWSTDREAFTARYLSTDALDTTKWPELVLQAVQAYLEWQDDDEDDGQKPEATQTKGVAYQKLLADALEAHSLGVDDWLRFQLSGQFMQAVRMALEKARWRFCIDTVSLAADANPDDLSFDGAPSPGYGYRMPLPSDWVRTVRAYFPWLNGFRPIWQDVDYREENGAIHANFTPIVLRYLTRRGLDSTKWSSNFRDAVLAWLQHLEARQDPKMAAAAKEKLEFFQLQCRQAESLDDERDMPRVKKSGRFVSARYSRRSQDFIDILLPGEIP